MMVSKRLVYKVSDERFADSLMFFISMSYMYSISLRCLFLEELNQLCNACAIEDHLHSLEEKKPVCSKEYRASENKKAFPESWAMGLTMFNPLSPNSV